MPNNKQKQSRNNKRRKVSNTLGKLTGVAKPIDQDQHVISAKQLLLSANPMPTIHATRLKYCQTLTLSTQNSPLSTFGTENSFRLNSLFDPDFSLGGHQPYGFDQMTPFYNRYIVNRCQVEIIISDPSADGLVLGMMVKSAGATNTVANSTIDEISERQACVTKWINDSGSQLVTFKMDLPIYQVLGYSTQQQMLADRFNAGALVAADPVANRQAYLTVAVANSKGDGTQTLQCQIRLSLDCQFFDRKSLAQS